jgi:hydrogenase expression/formation protein HypC
MCLGFPAKVIKIIDEEMAIVDLGDVRRKVSIAFTPEVKVGDWVIVHAGFALQKLQGAREYEILFKGERKSRRNSEKN